MNSQHLSDEAVAAFADGVLTGHARERATRHTDGCDECRHAVKVQREAVWALRAAPAPCLPSDLLARLRSVPLTTPINVVPTVIDPDGTPMLATFAPMAALVPAAPSNPHRSRPFVATAAVVALAGALAASSVARQSGPTQIGNSGYVSTVSTGVGTGGQAPMVTGFRFGRP